ncbi:hypothetical protein ADUPG1_009715, partial [Aduncisulcus paluster]
MHDNLHQIDEDTYNTMIITGDDEDRSSILNLKQNPGIIGSSRSFMEKRHSFCSKFSLIRIPVSIPTILIFLVVLSLSFQSVLCDGYLSNECSMYISEDDHLECNEVYPGRYAAECEEGYYYDEANYSCYAEDATYVCPSINDYHMCALVDGDSTPTAECRSAWYGDDCDELYSVHIPDKLFRGKVCDAIGNSDPLCDVTEFEMAGINGYFYSYGSHITSFEGAQYLINIYLFRGDNTDVTSVYPISFLEQLSHLYFHQTSTTFNDNIYDLKSLFTLNRLYRLAIYGNEQIYDISVSFRNVGLYYMYIANTNYSAFIPLCRSEDDTDYWTFITTVFPIHSSDNKDIYFIPNSCPLNTDPGNSPYNCNTSNASCPSIVLNEVYNSVDDVNEKQCAFIAKEGSSGECYTVHDDSIRQYIIKECLDENDDLETNGIISVATMRSKFQCTYLSLSDVVDTYTSISSVNSITTLQGLEYAQGMSESGTQLGLTELNIDGYDLSGDINSNAEYDKLVVQILAKAVTYSNDYGTIDSDLSNNSISDVSVLITSSIFPDDTDAVLTTLDISDNNICDIEGIVSQLQTEFPTLSTLTYSDQTCHCSASVSSAAHQVCREVYPDRWAVECWNGYYLDNASGECLEV